uniref:Uncharacterized protein n=1 Tax=Trichogramma kaykai TaxID=54128 RepID=A0ABD2X4E6_9HYME
MCVTMVQVSSSNTDGEDPSRRIDAVDKDGMTPLHWAMRLKHEKVAELLLRKGANPNLADKYGETPLHFICQRSHDVDFAEKFFKITDEINRPVEIDAADKAGVTPLHWAVYNKHKKLAKLLLRRGANPNLADMDGQTALHVLSGCYDDDELAANLLLGTGGESNLADKARLIFNGKEINAVFDILCLVTIAFILFHTFFLLKKMYLKNSI